MVEPRCDPTTGSSRLPQHSARRTCATRSPRGRVQEVDHVVDALGSCAGQRVLDVGCGPGRHAHELARRGIVVHGIDIRAEFVELAAA